MLPQAYFCPDFERGICAWENFCSLKYSWVLIYEFDGDNSSGWMMKAVLSKIKCPVVFISSGKPPKCVNAKYGVDLRDHCLVVNGYDQC